MKRPCRIRQGRCILHQVPQRQGPHPPPEGRAGGGVGGGVQPTFGVPCETAGLGQFMFGRLVLMGRRGPEPPRVDWVSTSISFCAAASIFGLP